MEDICQNYNIFKFYIHLFKIIFFFYKNDLKHYLYIFLLYDQIISFTYICNIFIFIIIKIEKI